MNYIVTITFSKLDFKLNLWSDGALLGEAEATNASRNLVPTLDALLSQHSVTLSMVTKLGFLSGPGSFTSSRIVCATCNGLRTVNKNLLVVPVRIDEAVKAHNMDVGIFLRCNKQLWHVYDGSWRIVSDKEIGQFTSDYTSMDDGQFSINAKRFPWPDMSFGVMSVAQSTDTQLEIEPYYGIQASPAA